MSPDRGCACGKEPYEYHECRMQSCPKAGYLGLKRGETDMDAGRDATHGKVAQVGGDHYQTGGDQHWDIVDRYNVPYLEGVGSKYPLRWRQKGGIEDLEKTLSYIDKILASPPQHLRWYARPGNPRLVADIAKLCDDHNCGPVERNVVNCLMQGTSREILASCRQQLSEYIADIRAAPGPGTPEDGGQHAKAPETKELRAHVLPDDELILRDDGGSILRIGRHLYRLSNGETQLVPVTIRGRLE